MKGALLVNLWSPKSLDLQDVKSYLDEFLMDKYVIDIPYIFRALLVRGIILQTRPKKTAHAYQQIWTDQWSPLINISQKLHQKVQQLVDIPVSLAMRYGNLTIQKGIQELYDQWVRDIFLIALYPQYAMASTLTVRALADQIAKEHFPDIKIHKLPPFFNKSDYIYSLTNSIRKHLQNFDYDHILFSYHGIPERHIHKSDTTNSHCKIDNTCCNTCSIAHQFCYRHQCFQTTKKVVELLNIPDDKYSQSFQSRLAGDKRLEPYTDTLIEQMPKQWIKKLAIITPAFVTDCLETLEEIAIRAKQDFINHWWEEFLAVPCLNDEEEWCNTISNRINERKKSTV